jgi:acyl carrier protein
MVEWPAEFETLLRRHCRLAPPGAPIDPDELLINLGVDSLEVVELIVAIEDTFDLTIPQEALTPAVFATAASVWQMVSGLLPEGVSPAP